MTFFQLYAFLGPLLCVIGAGMTWFNTVAGSDRKSPLIAGIMLCIAGIILIEVSMHVVQDP